MSITTPEPVVLNERQSSSIPNPQHAMDRQLPLTLRGSGEVSSLFSYEFMSFLHRCYSAGAILTVTVAC